MRRSSNRLPQIVHHKASGQARVRINGRDHYLGKFGTPESVENYARVLAEHSRGGAVAPIDPPQPGELTVTELIAAYWQHVTRYYRRDGKPTGEHLVIRAALKPLKKLYGTTPAAEFGPKKLKSVREHMIQLGWCRRNINKQVARIKGMFKWAASEELLPGKIIEDLKSVAGLEAGRSEAKERPKVQAVDDDALEKTLDHVQPRIADMARIQRLTAMRPGELLAMKPDHIDRSLDPWVYTPPTHKTMHFGRARKIYIGPKAQGLLLPYLGRAGDQRIFPLARDYYSRAIKDACAAAGVKPWTPNALRHSTATVIRKAYGLDGAQAVLGHSQADVTQVYAELDEGKAAEIMRRIG